MRSFILLERPEDRRRNRLVILGFIIFTIVISYIIYGSVSYGLSKLGIYSYSDPSIYETKAPVHLKKIKVTCGENNQFDTYVSLSDPEKEKGLSVFNKIKSNEAMIFIFDTPKKYSFWMKGMKFPIDMVWLDQDKRIVDIKKDVAVATYPELFAPRADSLFVLEFVSGTTDKLNIKIGETCGFDFSLPE
jgi:uncharacterized membrane protein (UPF0127 family)